MRIPSILLLLVTLSACATANPYETASPQNRNAFKKVQLPFKPATHFVISQGAFGNASHSEPGNQCSWDFDVPYGTEVLAVEAGKVIEVLEPRKGGSCSRALSDFAHNIKVEAVDGTVAQYVHVDSKVKVGQYVQEGQVIAVTAKNGFICQPQLHFGIYHSKYELYSSPWRKTVPLYFVGLPDGLAKEGLRH